MGLYVDVIDDEGFNRKVIAPPGYIPLPKVPGMPVPIPRLQDLYPTLGRPAQTPAAYAQAMGGQQGGRVAAPRKILPAQQEDCVAASRKILQAQQEWRSQGQHNLPNSTVASSKIIEARKDWENEQKRETPHLQGGGSNHAHGASRQSVGSPGGRSTATGSQVVNRPSSQADASRPTQRMNPPTPWSGSNAQRVQGSVTPVPVPQPAQNRNQTDSSAASTSRRGSSGPLKGIQPAPRSVQPALRQIQPAPMSIQPTPRSIQPALKPKLLQALGKRGHSDMATPFVEDRPGPSTYDHNANAWNTSSHKKVKVRDETFVPPAALRVQTSWPKPPSTRSSSARGKGSRSPSVQTSSGNHHTKATDLIARVRAEVALERQMQERQHQKKPEDVKQSLHNQVQPTEEEGQQQSQAEQAQRQERIEPRQKEEETDEIVLRDIPVLPSANVPVQKSPVQPLQQWTQTLENPPRPYNMVPLPEGGAVKLPFIAPTGYRPTKGHELPYFCPDRSCMRRFDTARAVATHFNAKHYATRYNDNLDGTLTSLNTMEWAVDGSRLPVVMSRRYREPEPSPHDLEASSAMPKDASVTPVSLVQVPDTPTDILSTSVAKQPSPHQLEKAPQVTSTPLASPSEYLALPIGPSCISTGKASAAAVLGSLVQNTESCKQRPEIAQLLQYPVLRELPEVWVLHHKNSTLDPIDYACAVAYMVGEESRCQAPIYPASRLSLHGLCIVPPSTIPENLLQTFGGPNVGTCVGCRYYAHLRRQANKCTLRRADNNGDRMSSDFTSLPVGDSTEFGNDSPALGDGQSEGIQLNADHWKPTSLADVAPEDASFEVHSSEADDFEFASRRRGRRSRPSEAVNSPATQEESDTELANNQPRASQHFNQSITSIEQVNPESWEVGPGRWATPETPDVDVAFSSAYTASSTPVIVRPDLSLHHFTLPIGSRRSIDPLLSQLRLYTITRGKVQIITGSAEFYLTGPAGAFSLDPGKSCQFHNDDTQEAAIICTTIEGYGT